VTDLLTLAETSNMFDVPPKVMFFAGAFVVAIVWIIASTVNEILKTRAKEQTKREIAAYVAEGSITPDDAARLMSKPSSEAEKKVADAVAWRTIKPEKAADLIRAIREEISPQKPG